MGHLTTPPPPATAAKPGADGFKLEAELPMAGEPAVPFLEIEALRAQQFVPAAKEALGARRRKSYLQLTTYECGEEAEGEAQIDFPTQHYTFAIVFVAVDILGFLLALWALTFRGANSAWYPVFIAVGFTALAGVVIRPTASRRSGRSRFP